MRSRADLHNILLGILGDNTRHVYFQPPESLKIEYPCIIYERRDINNEHANNEVYLQPIVYTVTVIDYDPDSEIVKRMSKFPTANFVRHYASDQLNHDVFEIYY